eukprot:scaffold108938_cov51-Phaeocystis_antarctica.AAC.1
MPSFRQDATAFNQPLSFDTSKVTNMGTMFAVRYARAPAPNLQSGPRPVHAACAAATTRRPPASRPVPRPASYALLSTRQSAAAFNQPLSFDTSKVTNMGHMFYVRSARALPPSLESGSPRACRLRRRHPTPSRLPARTSPRIVCPAFDSAARDDVQPAA